MIDTNNPRTDNGFKLRMAVSQDNKMQNFNAPKKGNKGVVKAYLILAGIFLIAAIVARYLDQDEVKTGANSSEKTMFASAK